MTTETEARAALDAAADAYAAAAKAPLEQEIVALNTQVSLLQEDIARLTTNNSLLTAEKVALEQQVAALSGQVLVLQTEVARLQALLDACENPVAVNTAFGFSRPDNTWAGVDDTTNPVPDEYKVSAFRTYLSPGQRPNRADSNSGIRRALRWLKDDGILWLSIKDEAGPWFDLLVRDILAVFPGRVFLTARHEPHEFWAGEGGLTLADYDRHQDSFEAVVEAIGDPRVEMWTIVEGYHTPTQTPGYWERMIRPKQKIGFDSYNAGIQTPTVYEPVEDVYSVCIDFAKAHGTEYTAFGETGTGVTPTDTDGSGREAWVADARAYLDGKVEAALIWNQGGCTLTVPEAEFWRDGAAPFV